MQYAKVSSNTTLEGLRGIVGTQNVEAVLNANSLNRSPYIGMNLRKREQQIASSSASVSLDYKIDSLNRASTDSDVFEHTALMSEFAWKVYKQTHTFPGTLMIPEGITLPSSQDVIGNSLRVDSKIFQQVMQSMQEPPHMVDPSIFNSYSSLNSLTLNDYVSPTSSSESPFNFFKIPWGKMTIHSSIANEFKDFPVYPEEISDDLKANYTTMPEIIYQYEPWQMYTGSGPRSVTYTFTFHRDMWTGDHRDGKANELIRFCAANCYAEYNGSAVNTAIVTLYMNGKVLIRGILTDVNVSWDGPLGLDNFYLVCKLSLSITEVSNYPLNYWSVMSKPLIG